METDYLRLDAAFNFLNSIEGKGVFVYGIERFVCKSEGNFPDINGIIDFSSITLSEVEKTIFLSKEFLNKYGNSNEERFKIIY